MVRALISVGHGRLHFPVAAHWIARSGASVRLLCGWAIKKPEGVFSRIAAFLGRKTYRSRLSARVLADEAYEAVSCPFADMLDQFLRLLCRVIGISRHNISAFTWALWGLQSRIFIKDADVFHVRSGAGQGGAIRKAKKLGMKVLVDHSALHPAASEANLKDEYARWGQEIAIAPDKGVWKNVIKDCSEADLIMVNANHIRDSFLENGFPPEKLRVVYLGVRDDFRSLKKDYGIGETFKVLFTGGFIILKGAEYVLESLRILRERGIPVRYDIVGSVGIPAKLKELKEKYDGLPIVYHGPVPQDDLRSFLADADVYLFPSLADGCAQSGMEALTAGLPVVATYQSGLPIEDGVTGCVVPMKDAMAIADKIEMLYHDETMREMLGTNAAKMMRVKYTWENYAANVKKVYEELVATKPVNASK